MGASLRGCLLGLALLLLSANLANALPLTYCVDTSDGDSCGTRSDLNNGGDYEFNCEQVATPQEVIDGLLAGTCNIGNLGGGDLYRATVTGSITGIVAETYAATSGSAATYYSVAVVKASTCSSNGGPVSTLADLKGMKSCHTGYRKTSGWILPAGYMIENGIIDLAIDAAKEEDVVIDAESVEKFFGGDNICAPRKTPQGPALLSNETSTYYQSLCNRCPKQQCEEEDNEYAGYLGALKCMLDGGDGTQGGDVAFVKHTTVDDYGTLPDGLTKDDLRIVDMDGCHSVDSWASQNLGAAPAKTIVATKVYAEANPGVADQIVNAGINAAKSARLVTSSAEGLERVSSPSSWKENYFTSFNAFQSIYRLGVIKVCLPKGDTNQCESALNSFEDNTKIFKYECVVKESEDACTEAVSNGELDFTVFGGTELYNAYKKYGLVAFLGERELDPETSDDAGRKLLSNPNAYYGVAVTKKEYCDNGIISSLGSLLNKAPCHTGYRKTAGWVLNIGYLLNNYYMELARDKGFSENVAIDAESAEQFFNEDRGICAARKVEGQGPKFAPDGATIYYDELCKGCKATQECTDDPDKTEEDCKCSGDEADNAYAGYNGAFQCMVDGSSSAGGQVAFVKQSTFFDWKAKTGSSASEDTFRLVCEDGCKPLNMYESCNLGEAPANAVVGRPVWGTNGPGKYVAKRFAELAANGKDSSTTFLSRAIEFGLFDDSTQGLTLVENPLDFVTGPDPYFRSFDAFEALNTLNKVKVCLPKEDADGSQSRACEEALNKPAFLERLASDKDTGGEETSDPDAAGGRRSLLSDYLNTKVPLGFTCTARGSTDACLQAIAEGPEAGGDDFAVLGGDGIYRGHRDYGLDAYVAENYDAGADSDDVIPTYYGVAVVKADKCDSLSGWSSLKGKSVCHTGYRKTAGWALPIGTLMSKGIITEQFDMAKQEGAAVDAVSASTFFGDDICAPGTTSDGPLLTGKEYKPLCEGCPNDSCEAAGNAYAGYQGAFKCMVEDGGDVAFVKHTTYDDHAESSGWGSKSDYRLLCESGCKTLDEFASCSTGEAPARAMMMRPTFAKSAMGDALIALFTETGEGSVAADLLTAAKAAGVFQSTTQKLTQIEDPNGLVGGYFKSYAAFDAVYSLDGSIGVSTTFEVSMQVQDGVYGDGPFDPSSSSYMLLTKRLVKAFKAPVTDLCEVTKSCGTPVVKVDLGSKTADTGSSESESVGRRVLRAMGGRSLLSIGFDAEVTIVNVPTYVAQGAMESIVANSILGAAKVNSVPILKGSGGGGGNTRVITTNEDNYKGRAAGLAVGLFFAGVIVAGLITWLVMRKKSSSKFSQFSDPINQGNGNGDFGASYNNPTSDGAAMHGAKV